MQLEVLVCWLDDLNASTRNEVFAILTAVLLSGGVIPRHVQRVYEICWRIGQKGKSKSDEQAKWALRLADCSKAYVRKHCRTLVIADLYNVQLISYIYVYAETLTDTTAVVDDEILDFFGSFLQCVIERKLKGAIYIYLSKTFWFNIVLVSFCRPRTSGKGKLCAKFPHQTRNVQLRSMSDDHSVDRQAARFDRPQQHNHLIHRVP